jgi:hypothetical protein
MKDRTKIEKIGVVALAGLCVFLVVRLVSEITGNPAAVAQPETRASAPSPKPAPQAKGATEKTPASPNSDSSMHIEALGEYHPKALPDLSPDPFDFGAPPLTPAQKAAQAAIAAAGGAMTASTSAGPGAPRIPLRAIGYSERLGIGPEAYLVDSDEVYIVHDGDLVSKRFKIIKITSLIVEIQDGVSGEKSQLPIPVVQ